MSDTPKTDAFEALVIRPVDWWDFARELERENAELREARDQLTADFRAQAKQLRQCNRELAQEVAGRKIREKLAAMQKEVAP